MELPMKMPATKLLKEDHRNVKALYERIRQAEHPGERAELGGDLCRDLEIHTRLEEFLFYPALARECGQAALVEGFAREHREVKEMISEWRLAQWEQGAPTAGSDLILNRMMSAVNDHVAEEEAVALPLMEARLDRDEELGAVLARHRLKLQMFPPVHQSIEVAVPVRVAYNQWTQFEMFPCFLENVKEVRQLDPSHLLWEMTIAGKTVQWTAEIYQQVPDRRIAWTSVDGALNAGSVSFRPMTSASCRVLVELAYEPQGALEDLGAALGVVSRRLTTELERFKDFMESRARETGAWRGKIEGNPIQS
jgi:uncharacterized membrane protein/hemerythrin-like domain-containing protein